MAQEQIDKFLYEESEIFNDKHSLADYTEAICTYLTLCSWKYSEERAKELAKQYEDKIKAAFENKETVGDVALDIGYSCG